MGRRLHAEVEPLLGIALFGNRLPLSVETFKVKSKHLFQMIQCLGQVFAIICDLEGRDLGNDLAGFGVSGDGDVILEEIHL